MPTSEGLGFTLQSVQAVAYMPPNQDVFARAVLMQVLQDLGPVYDGDPVLLPPAKDIPPGVPTVIVPSRDQTQRFEAARGHFSLYWSAHPHTRGDLKQILSSFADRLATTTEKLGVEIGRVGTIVKRAKGQPEPGRALAQHFCRDAWLHGPLNRPAGFELHAHKVFALPIPGDVLVNSWIRIKTAKSIETSEYDAILVEQDINTLGEEMGSRRFARDQLVLWFQTVADAFDDILQLYFPDS